jgi:uncharacterized protein YjbI with pentapeptide repeats
MAFLNRANLIGAELAGADLGKAFLENANLIGANLYGTNLRDAVVRWVTLRGAKNLSVRQLSKAATLYETELDKDQREGILKDYPHLLEKPEFNR